MIMTENKMKTLRDFALKRQFYVGQIWIIEIQHRLRDGTLYPENPFCKLYTSGKDLFENIEKEGIADYFFDVDKHSTNTLIQLCIWSIGEARPVRYQKLNFEKLNRWEMSQSPEPECDGRCFGCHNSLCINSMFPYEELERIQYDKNK